MDNKTNTAIKYTTRNNKGRFTQTCQNCGEQPAVEMCSVCQDCADCAANGGAV